MADVAGGRSAPMNDEQRIEAQKTIVGEFSDVKHVRGILSMGRYGKYLFDQYSRLFSPMRITARLAIAGEILQFGTCIL